jgi:hypothetical protein
MKIFKYLMIATISMFFFSCTNYQPAKKIVSVEYLKGNTIMVTTYEDGSTKIENLDFIRYQNDRDDRRDDKKDR